MAIYLVGDLQGCWEPLERLLQQVDFSPSRDTLCLLGDLVNRGPDSARVLEHCLRWGDAVQVVLGNHDLHLLCADLGVRRPHRRDTLQQVLEHPMRAAMVHWLRQQPLARTLTVQGERLLMVHAGVLPSWSLDDCLTLNEEVQAMLRGPQADDFLWAMYGNLPDQWDERLQGQDRLRMIVNAFTRLRFCTAEGRMDFESTESAASTPPGLMPWFDVPGRRTTQNVIAFGHWSTLGHVNRPHLMAMDTGCVWGGCLSAIRLGRTLQERELIQVRCVQSQVPG